jgi:type VI secretion system secreted protein Hcp
LKLGEVDGQSTVSGHLKELEINSFSFSMRLPMTSNQISNKERSAGRPDISDMALSRYLDSGSPLIMQQLVTANPIPAATLTVMRIDNGVPLNLITYVMHDVYVTSYQVGGGSGGGTPSETLSLNFSKLTSNYDVQKKEGGKEGNTTFSWDSAQVAKSS